MPSVSILATSTGFKGLLTSIIFKPALPSARRAYIFYFIYIMLTAYANPLVYILLTITGFYGSVTSIIFKPAS